MIDDLLTRMDLLKVDHTHDGWPAVRMGDITALCDEVYALREQLSAVGAGGVKALWLQWVAQHQQATATST